MLVSGQAMEHMDGLGGLNTVSSYKAQQTECGVE